MIDTIINVSVFNYGSEDTQATSNSTMGVKIHKQQVTIIR